MFAKIYRPSRTAMQSGQAKTAQWVLEFDAEQARSIDPLMGWTSSGETRPGQVELHFDDKASAISYAKRHNLPFRVIESQETKPAIKAYADNFTYRRRKPWTH